ncbi:MAG: ABC transporter permease [Paludibacteraceae bacterium]|jgi:ABC-2 type transport system permease protein|nr:ABC transporter permease [Paludibacteraceae bacterium]
MSTFVFPHELKRIFTDPGVVVIFIVATLVYPLLYKAIYWNEQITDVPVAVVDLSQSAESRTFLHHWNASPDIRLTHTCNSIAEAEQLLREQKVHGIVYFPRDFASQLADPLGQAHISLYCDMSSFLYMKAIYLSCNQVMLESMRNIQIDRYESMGYGREFSWALVQDAPYTETALYNPTGGYGSFLIPAVLVLILHQTLLFGICMLAGTARDDDKVLYRVLGKGRVAGVLRLILGRAAAYFTIYYALAAILLGLLPRLFDIPHIGDIGDILRFIVPYILACIFFSMTVSVFIRNRESGLVLLISTSLIFLFMAGISWPKEMMPAAWRYLSYFIPYTWGAHGFIHINSMGATLWSTRNEYISLWILSGGYFLATCVITYFAGIRKEKEQTEAVLAQ